MSRRWLIVVTVVAVPLALVAAFSVASWIFRSSATGSAVVVDVPTRLAVDGNADVDVVASDGRQTLSIAWKSGYFLDAPEVSWRVEQNTLIISDDCGGLGWLTNCSTNFTLEVPAGLALTVDTSSGDVVVEGTTDALALNTSSGDVAIRGSAPAISADTSSGDVVIDVIAREIDASTSSGDVEVTVSGAAPERVEADTGSGDVSLTVPYAAYDVDVETGSGDEDVDGIVQDGRAPRRIVASTGSGDVTVLGR